MKQHKLALLALVDLADQEHRAEIALAASLPRPDLAVVPGAGEERPLSLETDMPVTWTAIPDVFLREWLPLLDPSEVKVVFALCYRLYGEKRADVTISYLEHGTGLERRAVLHALASLADRGLIERLTQYGKDGVASAARIRLVLPHERAARSDKSL